MVYILAWKKEVQISHLKGKNSLNSEVKRMVTEGNLL